MRTLGLAVALLGLLFAYVGIYLPYEGSPTSATVMVVSYKAAGFCFPFFTILGITYLIVGNALNGRKHAGRILMGVTAVSALAVFMWCESTLTQLGYRL